MATKIKPRGLEDMLRQGLGAASEPARPRAAPTVATIPHRGKEAVLETDDVQIIVYELPDRP
jgi:hypothetical protein